MGVLSCCKSKFSLLYSTLQNKINTYDLQVFSRSLGAAAKDICRSRSLFKVLRIKNAKTGGRDFSQPPVGCAMGLAVGD